MAAPLLWAALLFSPAAARAADPLYLELSAHGQRVDLGLSEFGTSRSVVEEAAVARAMREVVRQDLIFPRIFNVIEGGAAPTKRSLELKSWGDIGADVVVTGFVDTGWFGRTKFLGMVYDVGSGETILKKEYVLESGQERRIAHAWADEVVRHFLGAPGIAHTRIVFVNNATGKKEVCVVDYDGQNFQRLTDDRSIALFPKWSPDGNTIAYTTYRAGGAHLFLLGLDGQKTPLCQFEGLNAAASWMPDGQSLIATLSMGRDPNLYLVNRAGQVQRALTNSASVDTAPSVSPDGLHLAFTSDRPGYPQIYTMDTSGANLKRLTQSGQCDSPAWSPQGDLVAFTMSEFGGNFDIYTAEVGSGALRRLTYGEGNNENPTWSPDGRYIAFVSTRRGKEQLWIMGFDGSNPQPIGNIPGKSYTPHWGP